MQAVQIIKPIPSRQVTAADLLGAMLVDLGCGVGGVSGVEGSKTYSDQWEWFDPSMVEDIDELPQHWQDMVRNQNRECWRERYCYVHAPTNLLCFYPNIPVQGIFVVTKSFVTPETVEATDLIHAGGQFTEFDTNDKGIWEDELAEWKAELMETEGV